MAALESTFEKSAYRMLLREVAAAEPIEEVYVPPWRKTMFDIYGEEHARRMKEPPEKFGRRAMRFAKEEHERRTGKRAGRDYCT